MRVSVLEVADQRAALEILVDLAEKGSVDPLVRNAALAVTRDCASRDDECEIRAVFEAVKNGDDRVQGLDRGLKYMSDPRYADFFTSPGRLLKQMAAGYNGEDCDGGNALIMAMLGSLGFLVAARAWGRDEGEFTHVYPMVGYPKLEPTEWVALDWSVEESYPGWEPEGGYTLTAVPTGE